MRLSNYEKSVNKMLMQGLIMSFAVGALVWLLYFISAKLNIPTAGIVFICFLIGLGL